MYINIDNDTAVSMLMDRLNHWTDDSTTHRLYEAMYENYVYGGVFEGNTVMAIVDNDYVNWCAVIEEGDETYEDIKKLYDEQGIGDISCEYDGYSFIEAEYDDCFLVRS